MDADAGSKFESVPDDIRAQGWKVAAHYDGTLSGHTFWLFVRGDEAVRGVGHTDRDALNEVRQRIGLRGGQSSPVVTLSSRVAELVDRHGSVRAAGAAIDVDFAYLSRLRNGQREHPDEGVLEKMGLRRVVTYERR